MSNLVLTSRADAAERKGDVSAVVALSASEVSTFLNDGLADRLRTLLPNARWLNPAEGSREAWIALLRDVRPEIVVSGWKTSPLPADIDGLQYLCHLVGSVRALVPRPLMAAGLRVTNWGSIAAPMVAEHALLLVLGALRSLPHWNRFVTGSATHEDKNEMQIRSLHGKRVAIHGFGQIARELVRLLQPFNVIISAYSAGVPNEFIESHGVRPVDSLKTLADDAEIFVTCEALTDASYRSIGRDVLAKLRRGGVFVNVGRGAIVDEHALAAVAADRGLRVACDVFEKEPLPDDSPLLALPGALYSPHIGGPTLDAYPRCGALAVSNVEQYLRGEALTNEVTLEWYDRST